MLACRMLANSALASSLHPSSSTHLAPSRVVQFCPFRMITIRIAPRVNPYGSQRYEMPYRTPHRCSNHSISPLFSTAPIGTLNHTFAPPCQLFFVLYPTKTSRPSDPYRRMRRAHIQPVVSKKCHSGQRSPRTHGGHEATEGRRDCGGAKEG